MSGPQGNEDLIADYLGEAHDYLEQLSGLLMSLADTDEWPAEQVNQLFRSAHSLKGLSACFGFEVTNKVTHQLENLLSRVREGKLVPDGDVVKAMFAAIDLVTHLTAEIAGSTHEHANPDLVLEQLRVAAEQSAARPPAERAAARARKATKQEQANAEANETVRVRMERLDRMVNLTGELVIARSRFQLVTRQLRPLHRIDDMHTAFREAQLLHGDLAELSRNPKADAATVVAMVDRLGEQLNRMQSHWGELAGTGRVLRDLEDVAYDLDGVVGGIHEAVLQLRMVPLDSVLRRLQRVARDTAEAVDKPVDLEIRGGDTQIDKRVADVLVNPLVHMLRNSIDHGIESPDKRRAAGKRERGVVSIHSFQRGSSVLIEIRDDGGGIDPARLRQKAIDIGAKTPEEAAALSDREAQRLIFAPGFSTAKEVTEVSGRGMGMDIVASTIKSLRGTLELTSEVGVGTTFTIQLPPSMSILQSLLIEVSGTMFALPLTEVREIVELLPGRVQPVQQKPMLIVREKPMPLVWLPETYRFPEGQRRQKAQSDEMQHAVVFGHAGCEVALGVDRLVGKEDLVIKPLCSELTEVPGLAGMAIRGDGKVTLILDPSGFAEFAMSRQQHGVGAPAVPVRRELAGV
ncbi:MAG: chemotaxis protein CheA [Planctomycetes bacterium]|nr:chemotaxis protein CheA [Planctomycetota bacterium]